MLPFLIFLSVLVAVVGFSLKARRKPKFLAFAFAFLGLWLFVWQQSIHKLQPEEVNVPLVRKIIDEGSGHGGRWYIPPSWIDQRNKRIDTDEEHGHLEWHDPQTATQAATLALSLAINQQRFLNNTKIPLIVHQTWRSLDSRTWSRLVQTSVNEWLQDATGGENVEEPAMAYIMWDDDGVDELLKIYEKPSWEAIEMMPYKVEKADLFRVAALKWFGGVYADVDTKPLRHAFQWVGHEDAQPWKCLDSTSSYTLHQPQVQSYQCPTGTPASPAKITETWDDIVPADYKEVMKGTMPGGVDVAAIVGIEADTAPDTDTYWRMGYSYPLQLTNWGMALAPQHPLATKYINQVVEEVMLNATHLRTVEILDLTGPPAFTKTVKAHSEWDDPDFHWDCLTGRDDPKKATGKVVAGDVLVLPITGFSPGRTNMWPQRSMGSQPLDHPQARLLHSAAGSWRVKSFKVEAGKACRTFLGLCRDWKKIPT